ncbi:hypothetical protein Taro_042547, partial [Colocasia esculenta]|nr:hypothetical protein [Colocasia esculenta]
MLCFKPVPRMGGEVAAATPTVISKFYEVREKTIGLSECKSLEAKCSTLLDDPEEMWIFDRDAKHAPSSYIGMEIERHLRKKVHHMERQQINAGNFFRHCLTTLRELHSQQRAAIMNILEVENSEIKSALVEVQGKTRLLQMNNEPSSCAPLREEKCDITDHGQGNIACDTDVCAMAKDEGPTTCTIAFDTEHNTSKILAQALKEKVEALLLLSQQDERHLLERDVNQKKMEDLQRNLVQVTTEKVKALVELAQLKKDYQLLQDDSRHGEKLVKCVADDVDKIIVPQDRSAKIKNLLKKTYLGRWVGKDSESGSGIHNDLDGRSPSNKNDNYSMDLARLKVENATLQESITSIGHLTSSMNKLRLSILKVMDDSRSAASAERATMALDAIFHEVDHLKTALSSSIPVSWSSAAGPPPSEQSSDNQARHLEASGNEKLDPITAVGFEMVELLILAAELAREKITKRATEEAAATTGAAEEIAATTGGTLPPMPPTEVVANVIATAKVVEGAGGEAAEVGGGVRAEESDDDRMPLREVLLKRLPEDPSVAALEATLRRMENAPRELPTSPTASHLD